MNLETLKSRAGEILADATIPELPAHYRGKVRDNYDLPDGRRIMIASDRLSAFDRILCAIPFKGQVLTQTARYWFEHTADICPNHVLSYPDPNVVIGQSLDILPVEIVVRGYLAGSTGTSILTMYKNGERHIYGHRLPNGLTLVAEFIPNVRSAAMTLLVPAGAASDPETASGSASVLSDWLIRGAGKRDSRQLSAFLDNLGVQRSSSAETVYMRFAASLLGKNLLTVLPVYADIVQRPLLTDDGFEPSLDLAVQQLESIDDEPSHKLSLLIRERHYGFPLGRPTVGEKTQLEALTADALRADFRRRFTPEGSILAVAGSFEWTALKKTVEDAFGPWT